MRPLSVGSTDSIAITNLIKIHSPVTCPVVLDCTYNLGKMWKGIDCQVIKTDIDSSFKIDFVSDFRKLPIQNDSINVIVFDPPHLPVTSASINSSGLWKERFGNTNQNGMGRNGYNINGIFDPFLIEAKRVLVKNGIILAKLIDIIHNHKYQWQHIDFIQKAEKLKLTACDMMIKVTKTGGRLNSGRWKKIKHLRRCHAYWIVIRKGRCESPL